jgi:D-alanine-D-alanine ligase
MTHPAIGIAFNVPHAGNDFSESSADVLVQVGAIEDSLAELGYPCVRMPFTREVGRFLDEMRTYDPGMIFNLCETVDEDPGFCGHPAALFELMGIPFSGSPSFSIMITTDKLSTKRFLKAGGIRTPGYVPYDPNLPIKKLDLTYPVIVKPRLEDASIGIDQESIFEDEDLLQKGAAMLARRFGDVFIEEYIEGREFNVSLLGFPNTETLPVAEIDFSGFPDRLYPIVGYRAKWEKTSFEYNHTPRTFPENLSPSLLHALGKTASRCFDLFMLRDYGRVDMRVDGKGRVYVLEVNANPCLSPDAGFAAAAEKAGYDYVQLVDTLVCFMKKRQEKIENPVPAAAGQR